MTILKEQWFDDGSGYGGEYRIDKRIYFKIQDDDLSISITFNKNNSQQKSTNNIG